MGRYLELNKDKNEILMQIYKSQEIAKLLLFQDDPLSQPDISNVPLSLKSIVNTCYIFPANEQSGCRLAILFTNLEPVKGRNFKSCIIDVHIMIHETWWNYKGTDRCLILADYIEQALAGNYKLSMGGLESIGGRGYYDLGNSSPFKGFNIRFRSTDLS